MTSDPQVRNISESGFNVSLPDGRQFKNFLDDSFQMGGLKTSIGNATGNILYEGNYRPSDSQVNALQGNKYAVKANGEFIGTTKVKDVKDYVLDFKHGINLDLPKSVNEKLGNTKGIASGLQGFADANEIRNLSFKSVESLKETVSGSSSKNNAMKKQSKMGLGAVAVAAVAYIGYRVVT